MDQHEEWKPIAGFPRYEVSSLGRVRSLRRRGVLIRKANCNRRGYLQVQLWVANQAYPRRVHVLVAEAFHGPRPEGAQVRHLDGDKHNNTPANLAFGTPSENAFDAVRHGVHYEAAKTECPQGHPYDAENTQWTAGGKKRRCRTCHRAHVRASAIRRGLRAASVPTERAA